MGFLEENRESKRPTRRQARLLENLAEGIIMALVSGIGCGER